MSIYTQDTVLIECILNVSEGKSLTTLDAITNSIEQTKSVTLLHRDIGRNANRTVFTFVGPPDRVFDSIIAVFDVANDLIDMRYHTGEHPRVGALDVIPFVPLQGISKKELRLLLQKNAIIWSELYGVPICWYGEMASSPSQKTLAQIRKGGYELTQERIDLNEIIVDVGPTNVHPQLGISCATVRDIMIAYNINVDTKDIRIAKEIARSLRIERKEVKELADVRFLGWYMEAYNCCQISTNIYDIDAISILELYQHVTHTAAKYGIRTSGSELIGMAPYRAFCSSTFEVEECIEKLGLSSVRPFNLEQQVLEEALGIDFRF